MIRRSLKIFNKLFLNILFAIRALQFITRNWKNGFLQTCFRLHPVKRLISCIHNVREPFIQTFCMIYLFYILSNHIYFNKLTFSRYLFNALNVCDSWKKDFVLDWLKPSCFAAKHSLAFDAGKNFNPECRANIYWAIELEKLHSHLSQNLCKHAIERVDFNGAPISQL